MEPGASSAASCKTLPSVAGTVVLSTAGGQARLKESPLGPLVDQSAISVKGSTKLALPLWAMTSAVRWTVPPVPVTLPRLVMRF